MHPMIKPALRRSWRDGHTLRFGVTPAHAVLLGPVDTATQSFLALLDGTRGLPALRDAAVALGLGRSAADRIAHRLADLGVLDDADADRSAAARVGEAAQPDLASLSLVHREPGRGLRRLLERRRAWVRVRGAGRVGAAVAVTLAQAGVGRVEVVDGGRVTAADTTPGGVPADRRGQRRAAAAAGAVRAAVPWAQDKAPPPGDRPGGPHLVVLAPRDGITAYAPDPVPAEPLLAAGTPHLYAGVVEATGFVGPLVRPGRTACAECLLRTRASGEPGWPLLVAQWRNAPARAAPSCDAALAQTVAGLTAATALAFLDGAPPPARSSRLELSLPGLDFTTTTHEPHPECPCGAHARGTDAPPPDRTVPGPGPGPGPEEGDDARRPPPQPVPSG
ncbi:MULTISPECIES: TOMM precursor leader peptide-binding protein [Streptomyces]|uniref:Bacteriocin biosynthesis cyclodehydratase domain-containing protein n=1 Tax=Streptomyces harbinensis TaxID=1176198 RepID=A0A1I6U242_9ACTN|nr:MULTISPECIES: TOMM precursor leader peptide-binding protein [Streptomyces]SFS95481.1 bacteriocin biosynthesis cyclodehydratase domain-containing protein [Streptomyces harbinensis]